MEAIGQTMTPALVAFHWENQEDANLMMAFMVGLKQVAVRRQRAVVMDLRGGGVAVAAMADRIHFLGAVVLRGANKRQRVAWERQAAK